MGAPTAQSIGEAVLQCLRKEAERLVPSDSDRESLEALDPAEAVESMWDPGWARDTLVDLLEEMVEHDRDELLAARIADDCCEDCGIEMEPVYSGRTTADPADERKECPRCGLRTEAA